MKTTLSATHFSPSAAQQSQWQQQLNTANSTRADISLVTREGDRITINSAVSDSSRHQMTSYDTIEKSLSQAITVEKYSITVAGDLNDQELADLANLLDKLGSIADDFFSGDAEKAVTGAIAIGDMGSITKLEANFAQTTAIQTYLIGPHPMPDMQGLLLDEIFASPNLIQDRDGRESVSTALQAQWQQFLEYFDKRENLELLATHTREKTHDMQQNAKNMLKNKRARDKQETAKQMFTEAKNTITENPRLTPLIPSLSDLAINKTLHGLGRKTELYTLANNLKDQFSKEYSNWLI
jgi:hypothetical protein